MAATTTKPAKSAQAKGQGQGQDQEWYMKSRFPVLFPSHAAFTLSQADFEGYLKTELSSHSHDLSASAGPDSSDGADAATETETVALTLPSTTADIKDALEDFKMDAVEANKADQDESKPAAHPFVRGLIEHDTPQERDLTGKMFTENGDLAHRSTGSALVDLFSELGDGLSGPRLYELLQAAWKDNPLITVKIIFNARSIHLGKASRASTYRCFGWLAKQHPLTLVKNLEWLSRPVIEKKATKQEDNEDVVMVEHEKAEDDASRFDVKDGVAHGYWKDLLNILALSANKKLDVLADPKNVLNVERPKITNKSKVDWNPKHAQKRQHDQKEHRHSEAIAAFLADPVHRSLHITISRLFADQLKSDLVRLRSGHVGARRHISLCAKWAPSQKLFHDKHTFVVSSIAELLHPQSEFPGVTGREEYLRRAREAYRKDVASLRKALEVVERDITAKTFDKIKYERVPSIAMNNYASKFAEKDTERFEKYIDKVAGGEKKISGAVLLPSKLIKDAVERTQFSTLPSKKRAGKGTARSMLDERMRMINGKVIDGQWKTLVDRIKASGTLENSIAVCDVSGSMSWPTFADGTKPIHSSLGLSLLVAEVTKPPFGGNFITFSERPLVQSINLKDGLGQKCANMETAEWGMNTNFVAVFENLILPMAIENKLSQEDMVKQIFVFSDMQFDQASSPGCNLTTSYERIEKKYKNAGYEMPKLIFWNLAGGSRTDGDSAPKPVEYDKQGTAMVSGYSQGMLKVFLDGGSFEEPEETEVEVLEGEDCDGDVEVEVRKKVKMDPLTTVMKAVGHKGYDMLKVYD